MSLETIIKNISILITNNFKINKCQRIDLLFLRLDHGGVALGQLAEEGRRLAAVAWGFGAHPAARTRHPRSVRLVLSLLPFEDGALTT